MDDKVIIVEYRSYTKASERTKVISNTQRLAILLREAHDPTFRIAPFVGYTDEPLNDRFGLVFRIPDEVPSEGRRHISLLDAYSEQKYMSLNSRFGIAIALVRAIFALHAVGWVHKSLCSENILFFASTKQVLADNTYDTSVSCAHHAAHFDFTQPRLFGFDQSRPGDVSSIGTKEYRQSRQLYTHPRRWGRPTEIFDKVHDIYALGVILLEIGCWRAVSQMDKKKKAFHWVNDEDQVFEELLKVAKELLPHTAREAYCPAVVACLEGIFGKSAIDEKDAAKLHKAFVSTVLDALIQGAAGL